MEAGEEKEVLNVFCVGVMLRVIRIYSLNVILVRDVWWLLKTGYRSGALLLT